MDKDGIQEKEAQNNTNREGIDRGNSFEELARQERERAAVEFAKMQDALKQKHEQLDTQQKDLTEKAINENLDEHSAKKSTVWIFVLLIVILAGSYFSLTVYKPRANYKKASEMLEKGNYDGARALFSKLGDYEDSTVMVQECDYLKGGYLLASGKYNSALTTLARIRGYKDRDQLVADLAGTAVQTLDTGDRHSAFVRSVGTVKAVGDNSNGQCNVEDWRDVSAIACGNDFTVGLTNSGRVLATNIAVDWQNIRQIAAGRGFFAGLDSNGSVHFYGVDVTQLDGVREIKACDETFAALRDDGSVVASGSAFDTSAWNDITEIAADGSAVYGLKSDGLVVSTNGRLAGVQNVRCIFAALNTVIAVDRENTIYADGSLTAEAFKNMLMIAGDEAHAIVLLDDGYVKYIGNGENGSNKVGDWTDILFVKKG